MLTRRGRGDSTTRSAYTTLRRLAASVTASRSSTWIGFSSAVWATLISLMEAAEGGYQPVVGVVSAPALGRRWWAAKGHGAFTGRSLSSASRLRVSRVADLADAAGVGVSTVKRAGQHDTQPVVGEGVEATREYREQALAASLAKIGDALTGAGITFLPDDGKHGPGVRARPKRKA